MKQAFSECPHGASQQLALVHQDMMHPKVPTSAAIAHSSYSQFGSFYKSASYFEVLVLATLFYGVHIRCH